MSGRTPMPTTRFRERFVARGLALGALASLALASPLGASPSEAPPRPGGVERYRIDGAPAADGCGGRIYLAARHITLDRARGTVFADVVRRTYRARFAGDSVEARGTFDSPSACEGGVRERWSLRRAGPDELRGTLESSWRLAPDCQECTVTFRVRAVRVR